MTTIHTAHGPGSIVDQNTVRGRTQYQVAGNGFKVWLDETEVNKRTAGDEHEGFGWPDELSHHDCDACANGDWSGRFLSHPECGACASQHGTKEGAASFDFEPTDHVWDNHTTLPYNWQPQFPVDMFRAEQTISPDHQIDLKERMHDSDSRTGEDREPTHTYPGPNPDLFAKKAWTFHDQDEESEPDRWEHLNEHAQHGIEHAAAQDPKEEWDQIWGSPHHGFDPEHNPNLFEEEHREQHGDHEPDWWGGECQTCGAEAAPVEDRYEKHLFDEDPGGEPMIPPEHRAPEGEPSWQDHVQAEGDHQDHLNFGPHQPEHPDHLGAREADKRRFRVHDHLPGGKGDYEQEFEVHPGFEPQVGGPSRVDEPYTEDPTRSEDIYWEDHPEHFASYRPAGLSSKYADIHESVDHFNDPVQRFRDDPQTAIQRHAYIDISAGLDHETGEWMDLVQADKQIRTAAWNDVRRKAMRLKREGAVHVKDMSQDHIYANVDGDNGNYEVMILKGSSYGGMKGKPTGQSIADWKCSCDWGKWAFKRKLTYVGRLCSHGYASYLTMQGEYAKEPKHPFRTRNGSVDDFKKWVKDENGDHIDTDAADSYLSTLETPATKEEAEKVYDYVEDHHTERPERDYDQDGYTNDPDEAYKTAGDVLNHQPGKLTPHLYVVPEGQEQHFEDLGDDRKTTGPDQIMASIPQSRITGLEHHLAKGEDAISEHHPDFAWHDDDKADFPKSKTIKHWAARRHALIYTADEDLINKLRDLSDDQPSEHFHDMQDHNREVSEVVEELHDRGYAAAPLVAMKRQAMWKMADKNEDERQPIIPSSPGNWMHQFENSPVGGMLGINDPSGGATDYKGAPLNMPGDATSAPAAPETMLGVPKSVAGPGPGGSEGHTPDLPGGGHPATPASAVFPAGSHPTDQFSSSGISGGGYKEPNAGKPGYSQSGQSSMYDPNGYNTPVAGAGAANSGGGAGKNNFWTGQPNAAAPAAAAPPAKAAPAPVAAPLGGAPRNNTAGPAVATPAPSAPGAAPPIHGAAQTLGTQGQPLTLTRDMGNYGPGNPFKGGSARHFAERYFLADNDVHTDSGGDVHTDDKNKPGVGSSGLPPVTPSAGGPPPNGAVGKGGEDHYKVISPGGAQVNAPRPQAGLPTAPGPGVVTTPGGQGGQQAPGLAGVFGPAGGGPGGGAGNVMSQLGPILNQIPGIGGALGGVMGMIPKGGSAQHFAAQYMHGAGSPTPMSNPAPAGKGKPSANQAAPATPSAPTAKSTAASAITGQIPNLLSGSGGGMGLASPTVGGMSQGLGGITKTLSAQHFARQYMAGGDFLTKGGPNWMDYPFAGSGPDRQDFSGTSEDYVEEHERPNRQETWRTDDQGDIIKYTQTQPKQAALFAARYFYADGDIAGSGDAGYGAGGATHPGGADTYGGGIVHAPSSGSGSQDFATVGTQGGSTPTMGTMTNTAAWGGGRGRDRFIEMHGYSPECKNGGDWCSGCAQHPPMHQDAAMANWSELPERERPKEAALSESSRQFWADAFSPGQSGYFNPTNRPFQNDDSAQPKKVPPGKGKPKTPGAPAPAGGPVEVPVPPGGALAEAAEAVPALATVASYGGDDSDVVRRFHAAGAGALGSPTGGSNGAYSDDAIATNARRMLRTAGRHFTRAEERELEDEFHPRGARNLSQLDLSNTHYVDE